MMAKTLRLAGIQVESRNSDLQGNLQRAEPLVAAAARRGAELVACPELLAAGYIYHPSLWELAEPRGGPTERWLSDMARQHQLYIGASFLETDGDDFFNTFTLVRPDGTVAGRVQKESLPGFEGWFISSSSGSKVIETEMGRVGVGICWDTNTSRFMRRVDQEQVDLLLMPHSAPYITMCHLKLAGNNGRKMLREVAGFYASAFGIPTLMVNKAAGQETSSPVPWVPLVRLQFNYMGQSTICNADGAVCEQLEQQPGIVFAEVVLDPARRRHPSLPVGYWSRPPLHFPVLSAALFRLLEWTGKSAYRLSQSRRRAAKTCCTESSRMAEPIATADLGSSTASTTES